MKNATLVRTLFFAALVFSWTSSGHAQALWKYTDKNGKVTYSDKAPKKGETAEPVNTDAKTNVLDAPIAKGDSSSTPSRTGTSQLATERDKKRTALRAAVEKAREAVDAAKKALADGQDPLPEERQIVVGRNAKGAPTGSNSFIRTPAYFERIAQLEAGVKAAEAKLEEAQKDYNRNAPS